MQALHAAPAPSVPAAGPATDPNRAVVAQLQRSEVYRDYQGAFETTTGLPLGLRPAGTNPFTAARLEGLTGQPHSWR